MAAMVQMSIDGERDDMASLALVGDSRHSGLAPAAPRRLTRGHSEDDADVTTYVA